MPAWASQRYDSETNTDHAEMRDYSPTQGNWLRPDPAGLAAVDPDNPQSWNRYAYVLNDPTMYIDPLGLHWECLSTSVDGRPLGPAHCTWVSDPVALTEDDRNQPIGQRTVPHEWHPIGNAPNAANPESKDPTTLPRCRDIAFNAAKGPIEQTAKAIRDKTVPKVAAAVVSAANLFGRSLSWLSTQVGGMEAAGQAEAGDAAMIGGIATEVFGAGYLAQKIGTVAATQAGYFFLGVIDIAGAYGVYQEYKEASKGACIP